MTNSPAQHALRELRTTFSRPLTQIILLTLVILLGISGPFETSEHLNFGPRLAYWGITVPLTFGVGLFASTFVARLTDATSSRWVTRASVALATAASVTAVVILLNILAFGMINVGSSLSVANVASIMVTAALVALLLQYMSELADQTADVTDQPPAILERLDLGKRGQLISMSVQDHYVEVTTTSGTSLLLMRLSDAMRETGDVGGLQVHRSHWAALSQIVEAKRDGDKALLTLSDGRVLPASRSRINALKEAGILPRT